MDLLTRYWAYVVAVLATVLATFLLDSLFLRPARQAPLPEPPPAPDPLLEAAQTLADGCSSVTVFGARPVTVLEVRRLAQDYLALRARFEASLSARAGRPDGV